MPENVALIIRFHLVGGEDVSVMSGDFDGEPEAVAAIARAVDERRSLVLMPPDGIPGGTWTRRAVSKEGISV
ncbi:hypothetical protein AB0J35_31950 [Nonomuraea angiospora]|uniref:hypothetical protein n=1 Tax=Nonomuraea angiospora TaxID=46172 RepID=UPI00341C528F